MCWRNLSSTATLAGSSGYIVVHFYKLGPSNINNILTATVELPCGAECTSRSHPQNVATITGGVVTVKNTRNATVTTRSPNITIWGGGFDPYNISRNNVTFRSHGNNSLSSCPLQMKGRVVTASRTALVVTISKLSPISFDPVVWASVHTTDLVPSGAEEVARLNVVRPSLHVSTAALSSDTAKLTIRGFGFDNAQATSGQLSNANRTVSANKVLFKIVENRSYSSPRVTGSVRTASRSHLVVSFYRLDAEHVGTLRAQVGFGDYSSTEINDCTDGVGIDGVLASSGSWFGVNPQTTKHLSDLVQVADIAGAKPNIPYVHHPVPSQEVAAYKPVLKFTVTGTGFNSEPSGNYIRNITYETERNQYTFNATTWKRSFVALTCAVAILTCVVGHSSILEHTQATQACGLR